MNKSSLLINKIGVDVAKKKLDIALDDATVVTIDNNEAAFIELLERLNKEHSSLHFVMEATGGYEKKLAYFLLEKDIAVSIVNAKRVRDYAKAMGQLAKNDTIDAQCIRSFAEVMDLVLLKKKSKQDQHLESLIKRRQQLMRAQAREKQCLSTTEDAVMSEMISSLLNVIEEHVQTIDDELIKHTEKEAVYSKKKTLLESVPGIGQCIAMTLLTQLPELGKLSHKQIAALVSIAPFCHDSGQRKGRKRIWGGRKSVRTSLYMPMMSAIRYNPLIRQFNQKLIKKGKPFKVALIACMRKLLTILNAMLKNNTAWEPKIAETT